MFTYNESRCPQTSFQARCQRSIAVAMTSFLGRFIHLNHLLGLLLVCLISLTGNDLFAGLIPGEWRRLDVANGMPPATVNAIAQDAQGFMWFGTEEGLVRYDGNELRLFLPQPNQPQSLSHAAINTLKVDSRKRLWIGTERGLDRWDPATESFLHILEVPKMGAPRNSGICAIAEAADGTLWLGDAYGGLLHLDPESGELRALDQCLEGKTFHGLARPNSLFIDHEGCLWIGTRQAGLAHYSPKTHAVTWWPADPNSQEERFGRLVGAIVEDAAGGIWLATDGGLCLINPERTRREIIHLPNYTPGRNNIISLALSKSGGLWIGGDKGGVRLLDPSSLTCTAFRSSASDTRSPVTDWVTAIYEDAKGDLWTGHVPAGVSIFKKTEAGFQIYQRRTDDLATLSERSVNSFLETVDGQWWLGTDDGLNCHKPGTKEWAHFFSDPNDVTTLSANTVPSLVQDAQGMIWVGTLNGGINRLDPATGKFHRYYLSSDPAVARAANRAWRLLIDRQQRVWAGTATGPRQYNVATDSFETVSLPLPPDAPISTLSSIFEEGSDGSVWTNRANLLFRLRPGTTEWERIGFDALSLIWDIAEDHTGKFWVASTRNGLFQYDPVTGKSKNYQIADGLPNNCVLSITEDLDHFIWVGTAKGLCRLNPSTGHIQLFDQDTVLYSGFFNRGASWRRSNGDIVFGTYNGLVVIQPAIFTKPTKPSPLLLTALSLSNRIVYPGVKDSPLTRSITGATQITVPSTTPSVGFHFSLLSYNIPEQVRYEYQLEGFDTTWQPSGSERSATYTNLYPGSYRFRVRAGHLSDELQQNETSILLVVTPAWWERTSVRFAGLLAIIAIALTLGWRVAAARNRARLRDVHLQHALTVERHAADMKARDLEDRLIQAQKMESVGRLAGGVAHDFNNMLQAILGNAALALQDLPLDSPVREFLEEIDKSGRRSADLTRQLLAFARKQTIAPEVLDLNSTVGGMLKMLRRLIGENIELAWMPGANLWPVSMDPSQIDQILANLCVNGRDAIEGVGKVMIETSNVTLDKTYVASHPDVDPGDYVLLTVSDTGKGMDAETRAHLFEPFFTTKAVGKGTGLGLATVFGIVKQNSGLISVYSELGHGSTFKIYLPRSEMEVLAAPLATLKHQVRGTETVLLVEDEVQILNLGHRILEQHGYTVLAASTPQAALALVEQANATIHLLITDVVMPGMNGKELIERLRKGRPGLPCIFMSGYTADVIAHHGVLEAGVAFLEKPFTIEALTKKVREILDAPLEPPSSR